MRPTTLLLCLAAMPACAGEFEYGVLLDSDRDAASGCLVELADGPLAAGEWRLLARSDDAQVLHTRLERCVGDAWEQVDSPAGASSVQPGGGHDGSDRIEWVQAWTPPATGARAYAWSRRIDRPAQDRLGAAGEVRALELGFGEFLAPVPVLGLPALVLLAAALAWSGRRAAATRLAGAGALALAALLPLDGARHAIADEPAAAAVDPANDSLDAGVDLVQVEVAQVAGGLRVRFDLNDIEAAGLADGASVLFLGNSLTYANDLPEMLEAIAAQAGLVLDTRMIAVGGGALEDHYQSRATRDAVTRGGHALVIMQQGPSSLPESQQHLEYWTRQWAPLIRAGGARPALYMVWPDSSRLAWFDAVRESYSNAALAVDGMFIPAGEAWRAAWDARPGLPLYDGDAFHPSTLGSYAAAMAMFCELYRRTPVGLPSRLLVDGRILIFDPADALAVQRAAWAAHRQFGRPGR